MTDLSIKKKRQIPITASSEGVKIAEKALIRLGFDSKLNFAKSQLLGRNTVTKFFLRQPLKPDSFKKICQELKLDWTKIAELSEEKPSQIPGITDCINPDINEGVEKMLTPTFYRQVTVIDKKTNTTKAEIKLIGDINSFGDSSRVEFILRESGADLSGADLSSADLIDADLSGANLSGADLSGADLSGAYLSGAYLRSADLSGAYLKSANLSGADLRSANLSVANLSGADLSGAYLIGVNLRSAYLRSANLSGAYLRSANLSGADLSGANLSNTKVEEARFSSNSGISESMKQDLIKKGAIFEDSPGDRSEVLTNV